MHCCISEEILKNHLEICKLHRIQRIKLPEADDKKGYHKVNFKKTEYQLSFVIYADFESVLRKQDLFEPSSSKSFPTQYQHPIPCWSCIFVKCSDGWYFEPPQVNKGNDAAEKFLDQALAAATICRQHLTNKISIKWPTQEQWREYNNVTNCLIYTKIFRSTDKKVCGHDNLTGEYRDPATAHATWITTLIKRKGKFHALFTTSKICCFYVIAIFTISSFWNTSW